MQYSKCQKCVYHGNKCQMIMAQAMAILGNIEYLIQYTQPNYAEAKCKIKIDYSCENFIERS